MSTGAWELFVLKLHLFFFGLGFFGLDLFLAILLNLEEAFVALAGVAMNSGASLTGTSG